MAIDFTKGWKATHHLVVPPRSGSPQPVAFFPDATGDGAAYTEEEWKEAAELQRGGKPSHIVWPTWRYKGGQWFADNGLMAGGGAASRCSSMV